MLALVRLLVSPPTSSSRWWRRWHQTLVLCMAAALDTGTEEQVILRQQTHRGSPEVRSSKYNCLILET